MVLFEPQVVLFLESMSRSFLRVESSSCRNGHSRSHTVRPFRISNLLSENLVEETYSKIEQLNPRLDHSFLYNDSVNVLVSCGLIVSKDGPGALLTSQF